MSQSWGAGPVSPLEYREAAHCPAVRGFLGIPSRRVHAGLPQP